jgi:Integrase core domain
LVYIFIVDIYSRKSDDNPYSQALFRTLKYHPTFPLFTKFATIIDARVWCEKFVAWYNNEHLHSALKFVTPQQRHSGAEFATLNIAILFWLHHSRVYVLSFLVNFKNDTKINL